MRAPRKGRAADTATAGVAGETGAGPKRVALGLNKTAPMGLAKIKQVQLRDDLTR